MRPKRSLRHHSVSDAQMNEKGGKAKSHETLQTMSNCLSRRIIVLIQNDHECYSDERILFHVYYGSRIGVSYFNESFPVPKPFPVHRRKISFCLIVAGMFASIFAILRVNVHSRVIYLWLARSLRRRLLFHHSRH